MLMNYSINNDNMARNQTRDAVRAPNLHLKNKTYKNLFRAKKKRNLKIC